MNQPPSGPPNPRQARYRQVPVHASGCPITLALIVICCVVAAISQLGYKSGPVSSLYFSAPPPQELLEKLQSRLESIEVAGGGDTAEYQDALSEYEKAAGPPAQPLAQIKSGQIWRLVTPMFLHFGPVHLLFNMMWLWTLGRPLETLLRHTRFLLLVIAIAVVSNIAQALIGGGTNFGGMSGVVYGLFGFVVVHGKLHPMGGLHLDPRTIRYMLIWLVLCFTGFLGPIANWAHTFGLLSGGLIGAGDALRSGGWKALRRRHEFRRAIVESSGSSLHQCRVCGKTEHHDPDLEFRVGADGHEYCIHHLPVPDGNPASR
jgi:membrane associated rhomboid family serine protease